MKWKKNRKSLNPKPVIYLDETYIRSSHTSGKCWQGEGIEGVLAPVAKGQRYIIVHAGGDTGFFENALLVFKSNTKSGDYHEFVRGRAMLRHEWAGSTGVIPRPHFDTRICYFAE